MKISIFTKYVILSFFIAVQLGCGSLTQPSSPTANSVTELDVPFEARETYDQSIKKRVIVLPIINATVHKSEELNVVTRNAIVRSLLLSKSFIVVSNSDFPQDINGFLSAGSYNLQAIGKIATGMGLDSVIEGKILEIRVQKIGDEVGIFKQVQVRVNASVNVRAIATQNGKEIINEIRTAEIESSLTRFADNVYDPKQLETHPELVRQVVVKAFYGVIGKLVSDLSKLDWQGRVAMVSGDRVFINAGRLSGIQIGDVLKITEEGKEVFDPETGLLIGKSPGRMKGTIEVISYFGKDGAIAVVHSGSGFRENDQVEMY